MSLVEAIEHIRMSQPCDLIEALRQLKREMNDGTVQVQWEDFRRAQRLPRSQIFAGIAITAYWHRCRAG